MHDYSYLDAAPHSAAPPLTSILVFVSLVVAFIIFISWVTWGMGCLYGPYYSDCHSDLPGAVLEGRTENRPLHVVVVHDSREGGSRIPAGGASRMAPASGASQFAAASCSAHFSEQQGRPRRETGRLSAPKQGGNGRGRVQNSESELDPLMGRFAQAHFQEQNPGLHRFSSKHPGGVTEAELKGGESQYVPVLGQSMPPARPVWSTGKPLQVQEVGRLMMSTTNVSSFFAEIPGRCR